MSVLVVIPARGGSKGIPRKNLAEVAGTPLVVRAVRAATAATTVAHVAVSTDDPEIAQVARAAGADVIERPSELADDVASSESALLHALDTIDEAPDITVLVQCTSPFLSPEDIDGVVRLVEQGFDCSFTASAWHGFLWDADGNAVGHGASHRPRRQELPVRYLESGGAYAMRTDGLRAAGHRFFGRVGIQTVPRVRALEIDDSVDLDTARAIAAMTQRPIAIPANLRTLVLDFDGTLTDDRVLVLEDGTEGVIANRSDGFGIEQLVEAGFEVFILSRETNPVVAARAEKLGLECLRGVRDKWSVLSDSLRQRGVEPSDVAFCGNDISDVECMQNVGFGVAVADAHPAVLEAADHVLSRSGGHGAVRELCDLLLAIRGDGR